MSKGKAERKIQVIGAYDHIDFPELQLENVPCKIDTGAATSALHCHEVKLIDKGDRPYLSFKLLDPSHPAYSHMEQHAFNFSEKKVKNSFGHSEYRYVIRIKVRLFGKDYLTDFTLADRENMRYPVLLGKRLLRKRFRVDVSQKDLSFKVKSNTE